MPPFTWLATARRLHAQLLLGHTPALRQTELRRAARAACRAIRTARICANDLPQALREYALVQAMRGKTRHARRLFSQSRAVALRQASRHEHARTLLAEGQVGRECGWPEAERQIALRRATLREATVGIRVWDEQFGSDGGWETLSLADRFDAVLEAGRRIAAGLDENMIYEAVRAAALRLLRGEYCLLLRIDAGDEGTPQVSPSSGETLSRFDPTLVQKCLQAGHAIASGDESWTDNGWTESSFVAGSALCAPLFVRRRLWPAST